jgi:hypothetical protein
MIADDPDILIDPLTEEDPATANPDDDKIFPATHAFDEMHAPTSVLPLTDRLDPRTVEPPVEMDDSRSTLARTLMPEYPYMSPPIIDLPVTLAV